MPQGGDTYEKYEKKRRIDGKLCLDNLVHDTCCRLIAEGEDFANLPALLDNQISVEEIGEGLRNWQWQRRIAYLKKTIEKEHYEPTTPDECFSFVRSKLVALSKSPDIETKEKIAALKALAEVAIEERKHKPAESKTTDVTPAMERLLKGTTND